MTDDTLDDLENEFEDEMEDILEDSSLDDPESDMDDDPFEEEDSDEPKPSGGKISLKQRLSKFADKIPDKFKTRKILIIIAASLLVFMLLVVGLLLFLGGGGGEKTQVAEQNQSAVEPGAVQEQEIIFEDIVELEPFERIRLKTSSTMGLISLNLSLELTDSRYRKQIYSMEDRLRKIVETQVAEMTWLELRNPDGKIRLKYELLKRMNSLFPKTTVRNIYFTYFIMQ